MKKFFKVFYSQVFNALFPIVIVVILLKVPRQEYTASVFLLINFANLYLLFSDYSSNISFLKNAIQRGGINSTDISKNIIKNIHNYIGIKAIILSVGFIIWITLCVLIPLLHKHIFSNILAYTFIIGYNLNFYWIYISSKKEYFFILSNFLSRLCLLLLLIIFVWFNADFFYLMPFAGIGILIITISFFLRFSRLYKIQLSFSNRELKQAIAVIIKDWPLVANSFLLMSPTTCLSLFIGFVKNSEHVIVYGFTEKIFLGVRSLLSIFVNSIYPVYCNPNTISKKKISRIFIIFYLLLLAACALLYISSPTILTYFKLSSSLSSLYYNCLFYFILTLIIISINVPFFLWLLVHNIINSKKGFFFLSIGSILIVSVFVINLLMNTGVLGIVQSLLISEGIIVLSFFMMYKISKPTRTNKYTMN